MSFGHGVALLVSWKQKIDTKSLTKPKTILIPDGMPKNLWTQYFIEAQGKISKDNLLNKDNTRTIKLAKIE